MENDDNWIDDLFASIDRKDHKAFAAFLEPDACFRFGNLPAVNGRPEIAEVTAGFFAAIQGIRHRFDGRWLVPGTAIVTGNVTYTRHDGSTLDVPFANVLTLGESGGVADYRIFVDNSALFQA